MMGGGGMLLVGTLVAVSATTAGHPVYSGQMWRYLAGAAALGVALIVTRTRPVRPTGREWVLLVALAATGLVAFNVCIVTANRYVSPAVVATVIGASPVVMALLGPVVARTGRPAARVLLGAVVVAGGTAVAAGGGGVEAAGVLWAAGALCGEVAFSLLALPLLPGLGALRVSAYTAALAVPMLLALSWMDIGVPAVFPTPAEWAAIGYLGVVVTAGAFLLWYTALPMLGPSRAGLLAGLMPVGAVATQAVLGLGIPTTPELAGAALVVAGILAGLAPRRSRTGDTGVVITHTAEAAVRR
ncbi:DMT family transporter [Stackebrandtia albiflava]